MEEKVFCEECGEEMGICETCSKEVGMEEEGFCRTRENPGHNHMKCWRKTNEFKKI